jgi:hypothetical protein
MEGVPRVETKKPEEARVTKDIINQVQRNKKPKGELSKNSGKSFFNKSLKRTKVLN